LCEADRDSYNKGREQALKPSAKERWQNMASGNLMEFTTENWEREVVNTDKPVLVDFWAPYCAPCKAMLPAVVNVAKQFGDKVKVGKLNVEENQEIAIRYGISGIPQLWVFKGGWMPQQQVSGPQREESIVRMLNRALEPEPQPAPASESPAA
jgi:thioredoxin 1